MKVRILSGNAAGQVVEMGQTEAEVNISTGFAEALVPEAVPVVETAVRDHSEPEPEKPSRRQR